MDGLLFTVYLRILPNAPQFPTSALLERTMEPSPKRQRTDSTVSSTVTHFRDLLCVPLSVLRHPSILDKEADTLYQISTQAMELDHLASILVYQTEQIGAVAQEIQAKNTIRSVEPFLEHILDSVRTKIRQLSVVWQETMDKLQDCLAHLETCASCHAMLVQHVPIAADWCRLEGLLLQRMRHWEVPCDVALAEWCRTETQLLQSIAGSPPRSATASRRSGQDSPNVKTRSQQSSNTPRNPSSMEFSLPSQDPSVDAQRSPGCTPPVASGTWSQHLTDKENSQNAGCTQDAADILSNMNGVE